MIWIQAHTRPRYLGFPMQYRLALPDAASGGEAFPAVLCLHDAGKDGGQFLKEARLEALVEKHRLALILPDGRLSCFVDMAHGPSWGRALAEGLLPDIWMALSVQPARCGVLGVGTGAFGAACLAAGYQQAIAACAAVDLPVGIVEQYARGELTLPGEWQAVFGAPGEADARHVPLRGLLLEGGIPPFCMIGGGEQATDFVLELQQSGMDAQARTLPDHAGLEEKLDVALGCLAAYLR